MVTTVDQSGSVTTSSAFGHGTGSDEPEYVGQTFVAADSQLDSVEFFIDNVSSGANHFSYRLLITTATFGADGFHPGSVLFESQTLVEDFDAVFTKHGVTVDTGHLGLVPGQTYAFILDGFVANSGTGSSDLFVGMSHYSLEGGTNYAGGYMVAADTNPSQTRQQQFAAPWSDYDGVTDGSTLPDSDLQFVLTFSTKPTNGPDTLDGTVEADTIRGLGGNDTLHGLAGADKLIGGIGRDTLFGDAAADVFDFNSTKESKGAGRDIIKDFSGAGGELDRIDVHDIDANSNAKGNQNFHFIGAHHFHHKPGELHFVNHGTFVTVEGDVNGDGRADFQIDVHNLAENLNSLTKADLIL